MRAKKRALFYLLGLSILMTLSVSCSKKPDKELLIGKWKINDLSFSHGIDEKKKDVYEKMLKDIKDHSTFEFKADHTYEGLFDGIVVQVGKWSLDEETQIITLTANEPEASSILHDQVHIDKLSEEEIVLSLKEDESTVTAYLIAAE